MCIRDRSNTIQVTTATLKNKANELKSLNSKFKSQVENLKSAESSLNGMWEGCLLYTSESRSRSLKRFREPWIII